MKTKTGEKMVNLELKEFDVVIDIIGIAEDGTIEDIDEIKKDIEDKIGNAVGEIVVSYNGLYDFDISINIENIHPYGT